MDAVTLRALARRNRQDRAREKLSYNTLADAIRRASAEGMTATRIAAATGLTRQRVSQVIRRKAKPR